MIITCVQPCFLPWQGYFEQMLLGEVFIYLDDVQYTKKDWRNRNKLLTPGGVKNFHVPVSKTSRDTLINEAQISYNEDWEERIMNQLFNWYKSAPFYHEITELITPALETKYELLVDLNYDLNLRIMHYLGHDTKIVRSSAIPKTTDDKNQRIIEICRAHDGHLLYDGKSAANFIDSALFLKSDIEVVFQNYVHTAYPQLHTDSFEPYLSILDLLMNKGRDSKSVILSNTNLPHHELESRRKKVSSM